MKQQKPESSRQQWRKAQRLWVTRLRNYAFHHFNKINARTLTNLQDLNLYKDPYEPIGADMDPAILLDPDHPRRVAAPPGPFLIYANANAEQGHQAVDIRTLLYSERRNVRKAAVQYLTKIVENKTLALTPTARDAILQYREGVESAKPHVWRGAATALNDVLEDDFLLCIQGANQCLKRHSGLAEALNDFAPRVLYPELSALDSIQFEVANPENEHAKLSGILDDIISHSTSLTGACSQYLSRLGYLPLAPRYGMSEIVSRWVSGHPEVNAWAEVWDWANSAFAPLPRYHACSVFVVHPNLIPDGRTSELWREIMAVLRDPEDDGEEPSQRDLWAMRGNLARHYTYHLESHVVQGNGAMLTAFAWWLSDRMAALFPDQPTSAKFYHTNWVMPALERSGTIWLAAAPSMTPSFLRYATLLQQTPWAGGLLALMGPSLERLAPMEQTVEVQGLFHDALTHHLIASLPFLFDAPTDPTYSLQCDLGVTVRKWGELLPGDRGAALEQLMKVSDQWRSAEGLCKALNEMAAMSLVDQIALTISLKAKAYTDPSIATEVWKLLSDDKWRKNVLDTIEVQVFGHLIEALMILQIANGGDWFYVFPHHIAEACERTGDEARRTQLFGYLMLISLASETLSAVHRVLRGDKKAEFIKLAEDYRKHIESLWSEYPPWVQAKLRALLSALD